MNILQSGIKATKEQVNADLDAVEHGEAEVQAEVLSTGDVEADVNVPITGGPRWLKGGSVTAYVKTKVQDLKAAVGGVRISKKFGK